LRKAGPHASVEGRGAAEQRALYLVAATFFLLAFDIACEAVGALLSREGREDSTAGLVLAVVSLMVMPVLAYGKQRTGHESPLMWPSGGGPTRWVPSFKV
jgi:divalent metal cation (Fe/Co/Zn/Cd) transporter